MDLVHRDGYEIVSAKARRRSSGLLLPSLEVSHPVSTSSCRSSNTKVRRESSVAAWARTSYGTEFARRKPAKPGSLGASGTTRRPWLLSGHRPPHRVYPQGRIVLAVHCPPIADVCPEAPTQPVTRPSRSVATMLIDIYIDGFSLHW